MKKKNYFLMVAVAAFVCILVINLLSPKEELKHLVYDEIFQSMEAEDDVAENTSDKHLTALLDSCDWLNSNFAVDSFKVVKKVIFTMQNDTTILHEVFFVEGGSCKGISHVEQEPQKHISVGDSVIYKKYYDVSENGYGAESVISVFAAVAYFDAEAGHYIWL